MSGGNPKKTRKARRTRPSLDSGDKGVPQGIPHVTRRRYQDRSKYR